MFPKEGRVKLSPRAYRQFRAHIFDLDGYRCKVCGRSDYLSIEHNIKRSYLRLDTVENCYTCCIWCNQLLKEGRFKVKWNPETRTVKRLTNND